MKYEKVEINKKGVEVVNHQEISAVSMESAVELKDHFELEIENSLNEIKEEDNKIKEIEKSVNLFNPQSIQEIKEELNFNEEIQNINDQADNLKKETLEKINTFEKITFTNEETKKIEKLIQAEDKLKRAEGELKNFTNYGEFGERMVGEYDIRKKSIEIRILEARGVILENSDISEEIINSYKKQTGNSKRRIASETPEQKMLNEKMEEIIKDINLLEEKANSFGHDLSTIIKFQSSDNINEISAYKEIEKMAESMLLSDNYNFINNNYPSVLIDFLSTNKIKSPYFKSDIFDSCLKDQMVSQEKIVNVAFSTVINSENYKEILSDLENRLSKDKQEALKKLPVDEILSSWEEDKPTSKAWPSKGYGLEMVPFSKKIADKIDELVKNSDFEGIVKLKKRLDSLKKNDTFDNMVSFEDSYPEWLKNLNINSKDSLGVLIKSLTPEEFKYYFNSNNKFIPFHLIPDYIEGEERDRYHDRLFATNFSAKDLDKYFKETGKNIEETLKKRSFILLNNNSDYEKINTIVEFALSSNITEIFYSDPEIKQAAIDNIVRNINYIKPEDVVRIKETFKISPKDIANEFMLKSINNISYFNGIKIIDGIFDFTSYLEKNKEGKFKVESFKRIENTFNLIGNPETLPEKVKEILDKFENQYGKKGKSLINFAIYTYGVENPDKFVSRMEGMEEVLNKYNPDNVPEGAKVSMGIEYEVTKSIADSYGETSLLGYKSDINLISEIGDIGRGRDAIHEIALKPNYNPYMLMAEVKLLQEAGLLDFNFERYQEAPRGYHLSLVGDEGLKVDTNMYFLNNIMTIAQLTGITAGKEVNLTKDIYKKTFENFSDHNQKGDRCEIKGMATDSVEQFEKAIITAHHSGIAIQLFNKYLDETFIPSELFNNSEDFEKNLTNSGVILKPFESDQERDIVYEWAKLKKETMDAVDQHNDFFIDSEFNGYIFNKDGEFKETLDSQDTNLNLKHLEDSKITKEELMGKTKMKKDDLLVSQTVEFVNQLTRLNNFFLLKSINPDKGQYTVIKQPNGELKEILNLSNIYTLWNMRTEGNLLMENNYKNPQKISIFDNEGIIRDGYYSVQGASEEMIIHKSQILLNHFNKNMEKLLQTKGVKRGVVKEELVEA